MGQLGARLGSLGYLACYAAFAVTTALAHLALSDRPAVGASGAISGMVGMFFVFHPKDHVKFGMLDFGLVRELPAWVFVGVWVVLNVAGLLIGEGNVAYAGHLGGFAGGVAVAIVLLKGELVEEPPGATLLDLYWRR